MRCCPTAGSAALLSAPTEPRAQNSRRRLRRSPPGEEESQRKSRQRISCGGAHAELSPRLPLPGPRRTPTAASLRTSVLTLRRERYSYRRCCRSACCSRATIAAKARSEAQSQLLPVRQREITEITGGQRWARRGTRERNEPLCTGSGARIAARPPRSSVLTERAARERRLRPDSRNPRTPKGEKNRPQTQTNKIKALRVSHPMENPRAWGSKNL